MSELYSISACKGKPSRIQKIRARVLRRLRGIPFRKLSQKQIAWLIANDPIEQPVYKR